MNVLITSAVLQEIHRTARTHSPDECMGLLLSHPAEQTITGAYLLRAESSPGCAEADPLAIKRAAEEIRARGQHIRGMFHSHANHTVFHSATDHGTMRRILPALAEANFERTPPAASPWVAGPGHAALPLPNGRVRTYTLAAAGGADPFQPTPDWTHIRFERRETGKAAATHTMGTLELAAGGVSLSLGLPDGAALNAVDSDCAAARVAHLYSLVVNSRGDFEAMCLELAEIGELTFERFVECEILRVGEEGESPGGRFLTAAWRRLVA